MEFKRNLAAFLVHDYEVEKKRNGLDDLSNPPHNNCHYANKGGQNKHSSATANSVADDECTLHDFNQLEAMETIIVEDLIKPLAFLFKYFIPFHDTITYDPVSKACILVKGGLLRKLWCVLWQLLIIYRLGIKVIPSLHQDASSETSGKGDMSTLAKGAYIIFIIFSCFNFYVYWIKTSQVCQIFNHAIELADKLHLHHRSPSRIRAVKFAVHGSWIFVTCYVMSTIVLYGIQIFVPAIAKHESSEELSSLKAAINGSESLKKRNKYNLDFTEIHTSDDFILIQIITAVASFINIFNWMLTFLHMGSWALMFKQLIVIFYWRLRTMDELGKKITLCHEIRTFNRIGSIIDEFNQVYGICCLLGTVVCVAYISPSIKHAFSGFTNVIQIGSGSHLMLSYIPMITTSCMLAEVQRMAGSFADFIKHEYGKFTKECGDPAECLCGIAIVHYDLATSNIGVKGLGFFTVSYQFITTIVSVIISYSILVVQMFPHDNSDIEV